MTTCPHGMPNPKTCVDCMEEGNIEPAKWRAIGTPFSSRFVGTCAACGQIWMSGDVIQRWDKEDRESKYTHGYECKMSNG